MHDGLEFNSLFFYRAQQQQQQRRLHGKFSNFLYFLVRASRTAILS